MLEYYIYAYLIVYGSEDDASTIWFCLHDSCQAF